MRNVFSRDQYILLLKVRIKKNAFSLVSDVVEIQDIVQYFQWFGSLVWLADGGSLCQWGHGGISSASTPSLTAIV